MPRDVLIDALNSSIVGCRHYQSRAAGLKSRKYTNAGPLVTLVKDVGMVLADARTKGYQLPIHSYASHNMAQLVKEGLGDLEASVLADFPLDGRSSGGAVAKDAQDVRDILAADDARYAAMLSGELGQIGSLFSPDFSYTHTKGVCQNKADYLASLASGQFVYKAFDRESADVTVRGDLAVMQGIVRINVVVSGDLRSLHNRYIAVWERGDDGKWRMRAWMGVPVGEGAL
jgi:ketosteroid isomerase-like protein